MNTTATTNHADANNNATPNGSNGSSEGMEGSKSGKTRQPPNAMEALSKITKILDQLSPLDRKRVLAFINQTGEE